MVRSPSSLHTFTHFIDHHQVVSVTPAQYFSRKRGLANGIVYASGGLGGTVISFAMDGLISRLGPAWTFRIVGFMTLATGLPAAWLIKERAPIKSTAFIDLLVPPWRPSARLWRLTKESPVPS